MKSTEKSLKIFSNVVVNTDLKILPINNKIIVNRKYRLLIIIFTFSNNFQIFSFIPSSHVDEKRNLSTMY